MVELVAIGILTDVRIHPRETFRRAVVEGTASIIVAHNHPSGDTTPSENDIKVTTQLFKAGEVLQIPLLDHLIFTKTVISAFGTIKRNPATNRREKCRKGVKWYESGQ